MDTFIFDWGNVLAPDSNRTAADILSDRYNIGEELYGTIDSHEDGFSEGEDAAPYYAYFREKYGIPEKELLEALNNVPPHEEMMALARKLKERGFTVAILSNQMTPKTDWICENNDLAFFDGLFFSNEIKIKKPKAEAFRYVLKELNKKPEECLFVDDRKENIDAAEQLGMRTHLFQNIQDFKKEISQLSKE